MLEGVLVLATLAQRWEVEVQEGAPRIDARFTLRPRGGLRARIRAASI
jgi:cytochrome P450